MSRFTKKDYQHLRRAAQCDLCGESMGRDDRDLYLKPSDPQPMLRLAVHPACADKDIADRAQSMKEFARLMELAAELEAEREAAATHVTGLLARGFIL